MSIGKTSPIPADADLEEVFLHFFRKIDVLPTPRSLAEASVSDEEFESLLGWFSQRWGFPRMWCENTWQVKLSESTSASQQEMFGGLLLILSAELCRRRSSEDAVWPAVTDVLKRDAISFSALFASGQPTVLCKSAIVAGARRLALRSLIDRYGAQEYFDTLKLQFGFTYRGAVHRLHDWLDGLGIPIAVRILAGMTPEYSDLGSNSFARLWNTLRGFRRSQILEQHASAVLRASPWIRPEWTPELLQAARVKLERASSTIGVTESGDEWIQPICEPILQWERNGKPAMFLRLNEERIYELLAEVGTATFTVDGRIVDRWTVQADGQWRGRRNLPCQPEAVKTNLRPHVLTISTEGKLIEEVDLSEFGMAQPLLIFDLSRANALDRCARLEPNRDYAFICDRDLSFSYPVQSELRKDVAAYRLTSPWPTDVKLFCDGVPYWEPTLGMREITPAPRVSVTSKTTVIIGQRSLVQLDGVPDSSATATLLVGSGSYSSVHQGSEWKTVEPVPITLGVALGQERLRVKLTNQSGSRMVIPKMAVGLRGIAYLESENEADAEPRWKLLARGRSLNRADGAGRVRIFVESGRALLYEGAALIGKADWRGLPLRDLCGWGSPLLAQAQDVGFISLADAVEDRGLATFIPPLFGRATGTWINWRTPMPVGRDHQIINWPTALNHREGVPLKDVTTQDDDMTWKVSSIGSVAAVAVAYQGVRLAAYWRKESILEALRRDVSRDLFSILRWLKVPVLSPSFRPLMEAAVRRTPAEFLCAWLGADASPGLTHRPGEPGLDFVARELLWNYRGSNEFLIEKITSTLGARSHTEMPTSQGEAFKTALSRLAEFCPSLAYSLAGFKVRGEKYRKYVRSVAAALLGQPDNLDRVQLRNLLASASQELSRLFGVSVSYIAEAVGAFGLYLDGQPSSYSGFEAQLRRIGESWRGRRFLSASLLLSVAERNRY